MQEQSQHTIPVIKQKDTSFPPYLDFQLLRQEGLRHIGALSGKIWTDHNTHDPGITILEVLCYALLDLGYRTALPIEDLLAKPTSNAAEDNFLSPAQALTCNPTSILDYRKMLLDVPGVRNAWLEPFELDYAQLASDKITHYLKNLAAQGLPQPLWWKRMEGTIYTLDCNVANARGKETTFDYAAHAVPLNGLYRVCLELEPATNLNEEAIVQQVQAVLSSHRNLCEDFVNILIFQPQEVGICADIELATGADAARVYEAVLRAVQQFIMPQINYYTLQGLLDKGKSIEDIFAGRPLSEKSHGFVDTEELEKLPRRTTLYTSDLYRVILAVEGVKAVHSLHFTSKDSSQENRQKWQFKLKEAHVPVFDLEKTCIELSGSVGALQVDRAKIHQVIFRSRKSLLNAAQLDLPIPQGTYHADLGDYRSIQNDFPNVYGIGENNLPDSTTLQRTTQALQLKGYLLLYDQLLANYLGQLTQLRPLFSLQQESLRPDTKRHTYFHQPLQAVSDLPALLQSHLHTGAGMLAGSVVATTVTTLDFFKTLDLLNTNPRLAITVGNSCDPKKGILSSYDYKTAQRREVFLQQALRDFTQGNYTIQIHQDRNGYFFILCADNLSELAFLSFQRFTTYGAAQAAANQAAFLATIAGNYQLDHFSAAPNSQPQYIFNLIYRPAAYQHYLQDLLEDHTAYTQRRQKFLDHLLARFAEHFTDYASLTYSAGVPQPDQAARAVEDKSRFLHHYADLSRNRGRAYDYLQPAWNTENVSGFEKRVSLLAGMKNWTRRNLCNVEIVESFRMRLNDAEGNLLFSNSTSYETQAELNQAAAVILDQLRDVDHYKNLELSLPGFSTPVMRRLFALAPADENVVVSKYDYYLALKNAADITVKISTVDTYESAEAARATEPDFIATINTQATPPGIEAPLFDLRLLKTKPVCYLNIAGLNKTVEALITYKWHIYNELGTLEAQSPIPFYTEAEAMADFSQNAPFEKYLTRDQLAWRWEITPLDGFKMRSTRLYADQRRAREDWQNIKELGKPEKNYRTETTDEGASYQVALVNEKNAVIAVSDNITSAILAPADFIAACRKVFALRQDNIKFKRLKGTYGFQILDKTGEAALVSYALYPDVETAFRQLQAVFSLAKDPKNYVKTGGVGNPIYRFLLPDPQTDLFVGISAQPRFDTAKERDTVLRNLTTYLKNARIPLTIEEEPRRYRWTLSDRETVVLQSDYIYFSPEEASDAFEQAMTAAAGQQTYPILRAQLYQVALLNKPALYRFLYFTTTAEGAAQLLLQSYAEFKEPELAQTAYTDFVTIFPALQLKTPGTRSKKTTLELSDGKKTIATGDAQDAEQIKKLQAYLRQIYPDNPEQRTVFINTIVEGGDAQRNYRVVQKNKPLAVHPTPLDTEDEAKTTRKEVCTFQPPLLELCKQDHLICPSKNPDKFHFIIKISDEKGDTHPLLISYNGYNTMEEAQAAYDQNWLHLLELASNPNNYGNDRAISEAEIYNEKTDPGCVTPNTTLAVLPSDVQKDDVIRWAKQFPIRSKIVKTASQAERKVYYYRVLKIEAEKEETLWQSATDYNTLEAAQEAYRLFVMALRNPSSCYLWCEQGEYRIGVFEILAESGEFDSEIAAWAKVQKFVQAAEKDENYQPFPDGSCFRFKIMEGEIELAVNPNCYETRSDVTKAMQRLKEAITDEGMHLVEHLLLRPRDNQDGCDCLLPVCPEPDCELTWRETADPTDPCAEVNAADLPYIPGADPYSFWATVVLPTWTKRFRNADTRRFFEQLLYLEAPALVGLNIIWLNPEEMCRFEARYKNFLEWHCDPAAENHCAPSPLCELVEEIKTPRKIASEKPSTEESDPCACLETTERAEKQTHPLFWLDCTDEPPKPLEPPQPEGVDENPDAIRLAMQTRVVAYQTNVENAFPEALRSDNESYNRALLFIKQPTVLAYAQLLTAIIENKEEVNKDRYQTMLYNMTWRLMDSLVQNDGLDAERATLEPLLKKTPACGLSKDTLVNNWNAIHLKSLFGKTKIDKYVEFLSNTI